MADKTQLAQSPEATCEMLKTLIKPDKHHWIEIMDTIIEVFPFLMNGRGRPSFEDIKGTHIAEIGASTWKEYVINYLKWKYETWCKWRNAYAVVLQHKYLNSLNVTVGAITLVTRWCKRQEVDFPSNIEEWELVRLIMKNGSTKKKGVDNSEQRKERANTNTAFNQFTENAMCLDYKYIGEDWLLGRKNNQELNYLNMKIFEKNLRLIKENNELKYQVSCKDKLIEKFIKNLLDSGLTKQAHDLTSLIKAGQPEPLI